MTNARPYTSSMQKIESQWADYNGQVARIAAAKSHAMLPLPPQTGHRIELPPNRHNPAKQRA